MKSTIEIFLILLFCGLVYPQETSIKLAESPSRISASGREPQAENGSGPYHPEEARMNSSGLIAHYRFDGNAADSSGNGNDGIAVGASSTADRFGNAGQAYSFDGIGNYVSTDLSLNDFIQFSVSGWVRAIENGNRIGFFGQNDVFECGLGDTLLVAGGLIQLGQTVLAPSQFFFNAWHFITVTVNSDSFKLYIDGTLRSSSPLSGIPIGSSPYRFHIGGGGIFDPSGNYFNGDIDDIRIYDHAIGKAIIDSLYHAGGWNPGSVYMTNSASRVRVADNSPNDPAANPAAYMITGNTITVEAWVFPMSFPPQGSLYNIVRRPLWNRDPWRVYQLDLTNWDGDGVTNCEFMVSDGTSSEESAFLLDPHPIQLARWTHIAGTYDGATVKLYVNGELVAQQPYSRNIGSGDMGFYIGGSQNISFDGLIDEVRLWNIARTETEIRSAMWGMLRGDEAGLAGYWPLDDTTAINGIRPLTLDRTNNHNALNLVDAAEIVRCSPGSDVQIAPYSKAFSLNSVVGEPLEFRPSSPGWPPPAVTLITGPFGLTFQPDSLIARWTPDLAQGGKHTAIFQATNAAGSNLLTYHIWVDQCRIEMKEHNNNEITLVVGNGGYLGCDSVFKGFQFNGGNGLWEASVVVAQSDHQVSGCTYVREFGSLTPVVPITGYLNGFDQVFESRFNDQRAPVPIGIEIIQRTYTKSTGLDRNYALIGYEIINTSGTDLSGIYVGLAADFDIGYPESKDLGGYDASRNLAYMFEQGGITDPNYYGITPLNSEVSGHSFWKLGFYDTDDWAFYERMTANDPPPDQPNDWRTMVSVGPYDIPAGKSVNAMFAMVAGRNLTELQANTDAARVIRFQPNPTIVRISDVPNDQGGWVHMTWNASPLDDLVHGVSHYSIWRSLQEGTGPQQSVEAKAATLPDFSGTIRRITTFNGVTYAWEWLANVQAHRFGAYAFTAPTLGDSSSTTSGIQYFLVSAHLDDPTMYFDSNVDSGYSVDNIAPAGVSGLVAGSVTDSTVTLTWHGNSGEVDLLRYDIYRSTEETSSPGTAKEFTSLSKEKIGSTTDTVFTDTSPVQGMINEYSIVTIDIHGNESVSTQRVQVGSQMRYTMHNDWNLISIPWRVKEGGTQNIFPTAISPAFTYQAGYAIAPELQSGLGYWLKFGSTQNIVISGIYCSTETVSVRKGWNIIGVPSAAMSIRDILSNPGNMVTGEFFGYDGNYITVDTLLPGKGYWVKVSEPGELYLTLSSSANPTEGAFIRIVPDTEKPPGPPTGDIFDGGPEGITGYMLFQNYPNPFNPVTSIRFDVPELSFVTLAVYNILGEKVAVLVDEVKERGSYLTQWDGKNIPSGVYVCRLTAGENSRTRMMMLVK